MKRFENRFLNQQLKPIFWLGLIFKIFSGFGIAWICQFYYNLPSADTFRFHKELVDFTRVVFEHPFQILDLFYKTEKYSSYFQFKEFVEAPRVGFFIKSLFLFNLIAQNNYWVLSTLLSISAFVGSFFLIFKINKIYPNQKPALLISLCFIPTCFFWSSGLLKESLTWAILCILISIFIDIKTEINKVTFLKWAIFTFLLYVLLGIKFYFFAALIVTMAVGLFLNYESSESIIKKYFILGTIILISAIGLLIFKPQLPFNNFLISLVENHNATLKHPAMLNSYRSSIQFISLEPTFLSILKNAPLALFSALFRPFIWEAKGLFQTLVAVQNTIVLIFMLFKLWSLDKNRHISKLVFWGSGTSLTFVIISGVFLAIASPNFGTLERYKSIFYPFFVFVILYKNPLLEMISQAFSQSIKKT